MPQRSIRPHTKRHRLAHLGKRERFGRVVVPAEAPERRQISVEVLLQVNAQSILPGNAPRMVGDLRARNQAALELHHRLAVDAHVCGIGVAQQADGPGFLPNQSAAQLQLPVLGIDLVWKPWQAHAENWQLELRRGLIRKKTGAIRLLGYTNAANMGIYREAVVQFERGLVPRPEITNHPWRITRKYGVGINLEQNLDRYLTAFGRFGWNNDTTESFAFTEVGQTVALGVRANGALWHRGYDRAGVAVASNGLSKDHQAYLALGGYGFLLGDGSLSYGRENILESYYTLHVWRGIYVAPGVQHIQDPGYNRDRGPVLVPSLRLHVEF